jgi:signal transduction histidine kinase
MVSHTSGQSLRILHLEDSTADHALTSITLRRAQLAHTMWHVDTLDGFRDLIAREDFDVILADYKLPGFTAMDAWELVSEESRHPPFILLSGAIGEAAAVDAIRLGIADYVLKDEMTRLPHVIARAREVHEARLSQQQAAQELAASQQRLAELTEHLQSSIEQERAAIAREIHDDIGGSLTAVRFDLSWIDRHTRQVDVREHVRAATAMLQHALGASQRIMMNLRPPILDQGLVAAVQWLADSFERRSGVPTRVLASAEAIDLPATVQLVAYRTAQEALTNVSKYATCTTVHVELSDTEGVFTLEVTDDGCGFDPATLNKPKAFGINGLRERARTVNGWLDISSRPGHGTSIILSVPLDSCADNGGDQ